MKTGLTKAHFQLTGRCNLACRFCGQSKGMLASEKTELPPELWLRAAGELAECAAAAGARPEILLWGGEPLLYSGFDRLAAQLHDQGFQLATVTNGTLLHQHSDTLKNVVDKIFISVDGIGKTHDSVRGEGVFARLAANLRLLEGRRGKLVFLTTVSDCNVKGISQLPFELAGLGANEVILQPLMYLSTAEIERYRAYSKVHFGCDYPELTAWERNDGDNYQTILRQELELIFKTQYPVPVRFTPHAGSDPDAPHCKAPFRRVHIRHDGEVGFCTDYFGFSAGNITKNTLKDIFNGKRAELFRQAVQNKELPVCQHCPWRLQ